SCPAIRVPELAVGASSPSRTLRPAARRSARPSRLLGRSSRSCASSSVRAKTRDVHAPTLKSPFGLSRVRRMTTTPPLLVAVDIGSMTVLEPAGLRRCLDTVLRPSDSQCGLRAVFAVFLRFLVAHCRRYPHVAATQVV